jgi:hypothetical protein
VRAISLMGVSLRISSGQRLRAAGDFRDRSMMVRVEDFAIFELGAGT